jgi:acyl-CoA dehydrogenase
VPRHGPNGFEIEKEEPAMSYFQASPRSRDLARRLAAFMDEHIYPAEKRFYAEVAEGDRWQPTAVIEELKRKARAEGLWNLFLPESEHGAGLTNLEYAPLCEIMGRALWSAEVFNCAAPDTGNMEVLARYGTADQKREWLEPLLGARTLRHRGPEARVARTLARGKNSLVLRDDRTGGGVQ